MANERAIFAGYDRAGLDREYDNRAKVADAGAISERWLVNGKAARASMSCSLDVPYGRHERHKLDIFPVSKPGAPILAFVHGGYWHMRDKTLVHFIAPFYVAAGINFISIGYRLCPEVGIGDVVEDVRNALGWAHGHAADFGGNAEQLYVAGHSAGGHLAAMMCGPSGMAPGMLKGGCSISGLHDLEPIQLCYLNDLLGLDEATARTLSPIALAQALQPGAADLPPLILTVGGDEGAEYLRQRDALAVALRLARQPVSIVENPGTNHFSACEAFCDPAHPLSDAMLRLILAPRF
jgi:arylformamidase